MGKKIIFLVFAFIGLFLITMLTAQNVQDVELNLFFWNIESTLSIVCFISFSVGAFTAFFFILPELLRQSNKIRRMQKQLKEPKLKKELNT